MDHAAGEREEDPSRGLRHVADGVPNGLFAQGGRALDHLAWDVVEGIQRVFAQVTVVAAVEVVGLDEADIRHGVHFVSRELVSRIVLLHVPHHERLARSLGGPDDPVRFPDREAHGLLDEYVLARVQRGDGRIGLGIGETEQHGVQVEIEEVLVAGYAAAPGHVIHLADEVDQPGGRVAEPGQFIAVPKLGDMGQVLDLGDRAATDHADPDAVHGYAFPAIDALESMPWNRCKRWGSR